MSVWQQLVTRMCAGQCEQLGQLGSFLSGAGQLVATLALLVGGIVGLRRYKHGLRIKAAELLFSLEEEYRNLAKEMSAIDEIGAYEIHAPTLERFMAHEALDETETRQLIEIDKCLRLFYLCTVLHGDLRIESGVVARSFYYWFGLLNDTEQRPALVRYLSRYYPRLHDWVVRHRFCLAAYRRTGVWYQWLAIPRWWIWTKRVRNRPIAPIPPAPPRQRDPDAVVLTAALYTNLDPSA